MILMYKKRTWSRKFLDLAGSAPDFPYPDEPPAAEPGPEIEPYNTPSAPSLLIGPSGTSHMNLDDFAPHFKAWDELSEEDRWFFVGEEYLPLDKSHAERISVLQSSEARELTRRLLYGVPGYSSVASSTFNHEESIHLEDVWGDEPKIQEVRDWLYRRGVPYSRRVYLLYDNLVVAADWKILVRYWDAFAWSVGVEMVALDSTKSWVCSFDHEQVITFRSYSR